MTLKNNILFFVGLFLLPAILLAFEGKVFSVTGNQVTITGDGVAHLKAGQKFGVYNGATKTGEIVVLQASHTQAKAKVVNGTAAKEAVVKEVVAETINPEDSRFSDNNDGTITDTRTGVYWQRCSIGQNNDAACSGEAQFLKWEEAETACRNLKIAGNEAGRLLNWRLPKKTELQSLIYCSDGTNTMDLKDASSSGDPYKCGWSGVGKYEKTFQSPAINQRYFPETKASFYTSSSADAADKTIAWGVAFNNGSVNLNIYGSNSYVRCVADINPPAVDKKKPGKSGADNLIIW